MKGIIIFFIKIYQKIAVFLRYFLDYFGFFQKNGCVFYPTCSEYTSQAIQKYGFGIGLLKGIKRIFRCHPWQKNHFDPLN